MSVEGVTWLELLDRYCRKRGLALCLTATHTPPGFAMLGSPAKSSRTGLQHLDVVSIHLPVASGTRQSALDHGDLVIRADLETVDGDLQAAAELLVGLLTRSKRQAA